MEPYFPDFEENFEPLLVAFYHPCSFLSFSPMDTDDRTDWTPVKIYDGVATDF
jgi:hypothetical protein